MFKLPETVRNKYEFVTLAAKRAEQLQMGAPPRTEVDTNKVTVLAQAEVAGGLIQRLVPGEATGAAAVEAVVEDE